MRGPTGPWPVVWVDGIGPRVQSWPCPSQRRRWGSRLLSSCTAPSSHWTPPDQLCPALGRWRDIDITLHCTAAKLKWAETGDGSIILFLTAPPLHLIQIVNPTRTYQTCDKAFLYLLNNEYELAPSAGTIEQFCYRDPFQILKCQEFCFCFVSPETVWSPPPMGFHNPNRNTLGDCGEPITPKSAKFRLWRLLCNYCVRSKRFSGLCKESRSSHKDAFTFTVKLIF